MTAFRDGTIRDVIFRELPRHEDSRGWLMELYRMDEISRVHAPVMSYISLTKPGVIRGPHEHREQTDLFAFAGPSAFLIRLWDNRKESPTFGVRMEMTLGEERPGLLLVPPGIVHGYKNVGSAGGLVVNLPNRLYRGEGKKEEVDEIRHEDDRNSPFSMS